MRWIQRYSVVGLTARQSACHLDEVNPKIFSCWAYSQTISLSLGWGESKDIQSLGLQPDNQLATWMRWIQIYSVIGLTARQSDCHLDEVNPKIFSCWAYSQTISLPLGWGESKDIQSLSLQLDNQLATWMRWIQRYSVVGLTARQSACHLDEVNPEIFSRWAYSFTIRLPLGWGESKDNQSLGLQSDNQLATWMRWIQRYSVVGLTARQSDCHLDEVNPKIFSCWAYSQTISLPLGWGESKDIQLLSLQLDNQLANGWGESKDIQLLGLQLDNQLATWMRWIQIYSVIGLTALQSDCHLDEVNPKIFSYWAYS